MNYHPSSHGTGGAHAGHATDSASQTSLPGRLRPPLLYGVWAGWFAIICVTLGVFAMAAPARYAQLTHACMNQRCATAAAYLVALDVCTALAWLVLALLVFWRRPGDRFGLFTSLTLLTFGVARFPDTPLALIAANPAWGFPVEALRFLGSACLSVFVFVFPDGRFAPRFTRWIVTAWIIAQIPEFFFTTTAASSNTWAPLVRFVGFLGFTLCVVAVQIWRYRHVSMQMQRVQTRWAVLGLSTALICYLALVFGYPLLISANSALTPLAPIALTTLTSLTFLLAPISLAIAILRYRLFDVDTLISRALVYGSLTALLALVYAASTLAFQVVITAFTKHAQLPPLDIVLSTLLVAAAFQPLRRALQRGIDRRFYRRRYDTRATVNAFAASLRQEIDLAELRERLLDVVQDTLQPVHVSLWLRSPGEREPES